jgi:multidrug resistance efflux pump
VGNRLIYADTYDLALAQLSTGAQQAIQQATASTTSTQASAPTAGAPAPPAGDPRLQRIRDHLRRYRELAAQGKWSEAGRELEAVEAEVRK